MKMAKLKIKDSWFIIGGIALIILTSMFIGTTSRTYKPMWEEGQSRTGVCEPAPTCTYCTLPLSTRVISCDHWYAQKREGHEYHGFEVDSNGVCTGMGGTACLNQPGGSGSTWIFHDAGSGFTELPTYIYDCYDQAYAACVATLPCNKNAICDSGESYQSCPDDCKDSTTVFECIGTDGKPGPADGVCGPGESAVSCADCLGTTTCNYNGRCDSGETHAGCANDCKATGTVINNDGELSKSISLTFSEWDNAPPAERLLTLCNTSADCMNYMPINNPDNLTYSVTCNYNSQIQGILKSDAETFCQTHKTGSWFLTGVTGGCVLAVTGSVIATTLTLPFGAEGASTIPLAVSVCALGAATGGVIGAQIPKTAINCDEKVLNLRGACIATPNEITACTYLRQLNVFGLKDPCMGGGIVAGILLIFIFIIVMRLSQPPRRY